MQGFISPNSTTVSVLVTPSSGNSPAGIIFPTQQNLQNRKIIAVEAYCATDMTYDPNNPNTPLFTIPVFNQAFLTLYVSAVPNKSFFNKNQADGYFYDKIPFGSLRRVQNNDVTLTPLASFSNDIFLIRPTEIAFNKCKVEFPTPVAMANPMSAVFNFHYLDEGDDGTEWMKSMGYGLYK